MITIVASYFAGLKTARIKFATFVNTEVARSQALAANALREKAVCQIELESVQIELLCAETAMRLNESEGEVERVQLQLQSEIEAIKKELRATERAASQLHQVGGG